MFQTVKNIPVSTDKTLLHAIPKVYKWMEGCKNPIGVFEGG